MSDPYLPRLVGIVGGGFMGSGIAECTARAGVPTIIFEPSERALEASRSRIEASTAHATRTAKLTAEAAAELLDLIVYTTELDELREVEIAVEAVTEDAALKTRLFAELDQILPEGSLLASNTSSIPIAELAAATARPDRVVGMHFFSPVPVMKLVEIVVGLDTSEATADRACAIAQAIGKQPIKTKDRSGFIVNTLLVPYLMAAVRMYEEGFAGREEIDQGMRIGCGHPMGPLALSDLIGLDVLYAICDSLYEEFKRAEYAPPPLLKRMVASGRLGRKTGRGFFDYANAADAEVVAARRSG